MKRPRRRNGPLMYALYVNAALLVAILAVMLSRGGFGVSSTANAALPMPPIAGGSGVYVMPGQFASNAWGCYLLDVDSQTLCVYTFEPGPQQRLRLAAARNFRFDRQLNDFNNAKPDPLEVKRLVELQKSGIRGRDPQDPEPVAVPQTEPSGPAGLPDAPAITPIAPDGPK